MHLPNVSNSPTFTKLIIVVYNLNPFLSNSFFSDVMNIFFNILMDFFYILLLHEAIDFKEFFFKHS